MNQTYILPLADSRTSLETVGGKGASLAKLIGAGLPVPDGFHVTTEAYSKFIDANDLGGIIQQAVDTVDLTRPSTLESASRSITGAVIQSEIPPEIAADIVQAYAAIPGKNPAVAVRSSATAEDLPEASFAGQQDSYLNICGPGQLLDAVKRCWASLWTARAIQLSHPARDSGGRRCAGGCYSAARTGRSSRHPFHRQFHHRCTGSGSDQRILGTGGSDRGRQGNTRHNYR